MTYGDIWYLVVILALWGVLLFEYKKEPNVMTCQFGFDIISAIFLYCNFDVLKSARAVKYKFC